MSATKHADEFLRMSAVDALAAVDGKASIGILTRCLKDEDPQVREAASAALGRLGPISASAVPDLIMLLDEVYVRESAARTLGMIGPPAASAISKLEQLAAKTNIENLRSIATTSLRQIGNQPTNKRVNRSDENGKN